jgi:arsenite methyltransferase
MVLRKEHWKNIYKTKDHKQVSWYQKSPEISLELLSKIHAEPSQSILDVGCGTSVLVDKLIEQGYRNITLVDLSEEALSIIKDRLGNLSNIPNFLSQNITKSSFTTPFEIWHDRAVFHFLVDEKDRKDYMSTLARSLTNNGRAIIGTFSLNGPNTCSGLNVVQYDEEMMTLELNPDLELEDAVTSIHKMPNGEEQEFMYFIIKHKAT